jgi:uncharacterized damage-inducible protein DinB
VDERDRRSLEIVGNDAEVGRWLSAMDECRGRTLRELDGISQAELERMPVGANNSVATLLYHLALIEADWLFNEILQVGDATASLGALLPYDDRDLEGRLTEVQEMTIDDHLGRLAAVRGLLHEHLDTMGAEDFHRFRVCSDYDVTPAWVLHHLLQHEAEHRSEIAWIRDRLRA